MKSRTTRGRRRRDEALERGGTSPCRGVAKKEQLKQKLKVTSSQRRWCGGAASQRPRNARRSRRGPTAPLRPIEAPAAKKTKKAGHACVSIDHGHLAQKHGRARRTRARSMRRSTTQVGGSQGGGGPERRISRGQSVRSDISVFAAIEKRKRERADHLPDRSHGRPPKQDARVESTLSRTAPPARRFARRLASWAKTSPRPSLSRWSSALLNNERSPWRTSRHRTPHPRRGPRPVLDDFARAAGSPRLMRAGRRRVLQGGAELQELAARLRGSAGLPIKDSSINDPNDYGDRWRKLPQGARDSDTRII